MKIQHLLFALSSLTLTFNPVQAEILRFNVYLQTNADDNIGRQLAYQVREKLNKSSTLSLIDDNKKSSIQVKIVTMSPQNDSNNSISTIYSEVILIKFENESYARYDSSFVGTCGKNVIASCADTIIGNIDNLANDIRTSD